MLVRGVVGLGIVALGLSFTATASADPVCGSIPAGSSGWNVPNGGTVFISGPGPIHDVISAIGQTRSHSILSNGPGGYVTHATSVTPPVTGDRSFCGSECMNPINGNFLHNSMPGLEQVDQGAIYTFIYGGAGNSFIAFQHGVPGGTDWGNTIANFSWSGGSNGISFNYLASSTDSNQRFWNVTYNGAQSHYGWNQYMNIQGVNSKGAFGLDTGVICSTALTMWQHDAAPGYAGGTPVATHTYPSSMIGPAANALYNAVKSECEGTSGFFTSFGAAATQIGLAALCGTCGAACGLCWAGIGCGNMNSYDGDPCDEAADQMVNAFTTNMATYGDDCNYDNENHWHGVVSNTSSVTISPDDVSGWSTTPYAANSPGSSVWGYDVNNTVQWNSGGTVYGCID